MADIKKILEAAADEFNRGSALSAFQGLCEAIRELDKRTKALGITQVYECAYQGCKKGVAEPERFCPEHKAMVRSPLGAGGY
jgi:hypothetical protein